MLCEDKNDELVGSDTAYDIEYKERTLVVIKPENGYELIE
jgi:hypothetical protein